MILMCDGRFAIKRIQLVETKFLVVAIAQIHVLEVWVERHGTILALSIIPYLVERIRRFLVRDKLLIRRLHGIVEQRQAKAC